MAKTVTRSPAEFTHWNRVMKKTRRTSTTVQEHEVLLIKRPRKPPITLCKECSEAVALVTLDEAVRISGISSRAVYRLIEEAYMPRYIARQTVEMRASGLVIEEQEFPDYDEAHFVSDSRPAAKPISLRRHIVFDNRNGLGGAGV